MALDQQHEAQQQGVELPTDDTPKSVEVDIEAGKATEVQEQETPPKQNDPDGQQQTQQQKPPLPRPQQRIQTLTHERDSIASERDRLMQELADARKQAAQERTAREQAERSGMEAFVRSTKAEVQAAKLALAAAKEAKDDAAEVDAQMRLARAVAEEADADAWVAQNPKPSEGQQQQQRPQQQPQEFQPLAGPVRDFIAENPWFNATQIGNDGRPLVDRASGRQISNPDFDPEMHDMAMMEDRRIQREIRIGALKADYMGSPEYFERIKSRVMTEFPDAFEPPEEEPPQQSGRRAPQMDAPRQPVAPSNRQIPGQQRQQQGNKMRLSGEEADLVRSLVDNGTMIYPRTHPDATKRGTKMSYDDAYVQYAKNKQADQANRQ